MSKHLKLDIVSDISCPWCIIGYQALNQAIAKLASEITVDITWQPFELNPHMPKEGQEITEHITEKYGISVEQSNQNGNPNDHQALLSVIDKVGLNIEIAQKILASNQYAQDVRDLQSKYQSAGISSVPAVIINNKHLLSGGQPTYVFEKALREVAEEN
jgi:predicted DsbA family dithiol-disulfide isomerase